MNREELVNKLQGFKNACYEKGYIYNELTLDEAYPGIVPTSFIVNLVAKKSWHYDSLSKALDKLIDVLWETVEEKTRENVFTLSVYSLEEMVNSERLRDRELAATNPDLTSEQIKKLFHDKDNWVKGKLIDHIQADILTEQQIQSIFDTEDKEIINILGKNTKAADVAFNKDELKYYWLKYFL